MRTEKKNEEYEQAPEKLFNNLNQKNKRKIRIKKKDEKTITTNKRILKYTLRIFDSCYFCLFFQCVFA